MQFTFINKYKIQAVSSKTTNKEYQVLYVLSTWNTGIYLKYFIRYFYSKKFPALLTHLLL